MEVLFYIFSQFWASRLHSKYIYILFILFCKQDIIDAVMI